MYLRAIGSDIFELVKLSRSGGEDGLDVYLWSVKRTSSPQNRFNLTKSKMSEPIALRNVAISMFPLSFFESLMLKKWLSLFVKTITNVSENPPHIRLTIKW